MDKQCRIVNKFAIHQNDLTWLLRLCKFPVETLDAVVGVIYHGVFTVVGGHNLSINAPLSWMSEESLKEMLSVQQALIHPEIDVIGYQHVITPPHCEEIWDHQKISPYSKECFLSRSGEVFLKRCVELLAQKWAEEVDGEYDPFSFAFLHNHPVLRPEYLPSELRVDYETAHDLSGSPLPFIEWLKQLGQKAELSVADQKFIRTHATDGIGLLVLGAEQQDFVKTESISSFVTGWQVTKSEPRPVQGGVYSYQSLDREYANFLYTTAEMVRTMIHQARRETSFWPTFAARSNKFLHADPENCSLQAAM